MRTFATSLLVGLGLFGLGACGGRPPIVGGPFPGSAASETYPIGSETVTLKDGTHVKRTGEGVDDVIATDLTGAKLDLDLDGDGDTDEVVVLTHDEGALKQHYLAALLNEGEHVRTLTTALGLNVLVQELRLAEKGGVSVELLTHEEGTPEDAAPTLRTTKVFELKNGSLVEANAKPATKNAP